MAGLLVYITFSVGFGGFGLILLLVPSLFSRRARLWWKTLWTLVSISVRRMFNEILNDAYFWRPDLKCIVSGKFFRISPAFSGFVFKYFNLLVLGLILCILMVITGTLMRTIL
ncbi:MAG: hypothetical protein A2161_02030 [Candidatus Schekmanbacteria bacterium RBG_13_48_7]|uniref:Uncharacterized protein n=1 Tax=Candidatus Schekmanbacteria bacterium RBG_13_48_7 TaxID=1817878 RepID=A0A1F7RWS8_9BACT|nr:MAG: hypothetical protein A2161_02030 [Candidatus Schekmanbacteria bacterium RBG_13_48_7]